MLGAPVHQPRPATVASAPYDRRVPVDRSPGGFYTSPMSEFLDKAKDKIGDVVDKVEEKIPDSVKEKASDLAEKAGDAVDKLVDKLPDSIQSKVEPIVDKITGGDDKGGDAGAAPTE
jgi:hypothetical protein